MKEFRFAIKNQPGALAKIAGTIGEERINIDGIAGMGLDGEGVVCFITDNPGKTRTVLQNQGTKFEEKEAVVIDVPNHPGELGRLLDRLANEGLNVLSAYAAVERNKIVLTVDDVAKAKQVLRIA